MPGGRPDTAGIWLLDLTVAGHTYRYATEGVTVTDADGFTYDYAEGLADPAVAYGAVVGADDVSIAVEILAEDVDWAALVAAGHALDQCPAVLRRWHEGDDLERARVAVRGRTDAPVYGAAGEALTLSVVRSLRNQTRTLPPPQAVVDASTWVATALTSTPENYVGSTYPMVIGCPGDVGGGHPEPCVPVPLAAYRAGGLTATKVVWLGGHAEQVRIRYIGEDPVPPDVTLTTDSQSDDLGRAVAIARPEDDNPEGEYLLGFSSASGWGGGLVYRGQLVRGAGTLSEWGLRTYYDGDVDWGRVAAIKPFLDSFRIDTWIDSPTNFYAWWQGEILSLLPVEIRESSAGLYLALRRYDLTEADAVAHLDATAGSGRVTRATPVAVVNDGPFNEITVDYRPLDGSRWLARHVLTGEAGVLVGLDAIEDPVADTRIVRDHLCAESQRRYGVRPIRIQAGAVWDSGTAVLIARHVAARSAWPRRVVQYVGGPWLDSLEVGAAVTVTDPEVYLDREVAVVTDVLPGAGETTVTVEILDRPTHRIRRTS